MQYIASYLGLCVCVHSGMHPLQLQRTRTVCTLHALHAPYFWHCPENLTSYYLQSHREYCKRELISWVCVCTLRHVPPPTSTHTHGMHTAHPACTLVVAQT